MKIATRNAPFAQGDVLFVPVDRLPANMKFVEAKSENGNIIVTHSETGHHHIVKERPTVKMFDEAMNIFRSYLVVDDGPVELEHLRSFDTHESIQIPAGVWEVHRQQEMGLDGWRRAAD